jgi:hypothetical protein
MNLSLITTKLMIKEPRDVETLVNLRLMMTVTELLMYVNHCINFFLYCATGHKFRAELYWLLRRRKSSHGQHVIELTGVLSRAMQVNLVEPKDILKSQKTTSV